MATLAERASKSRMTINKIEKGDPGVSVGAYATVLLCVRDARQARRCGGRTARSVGRELDEEHCRIAFICRAGRNHWVATGRVADGKGSHCIYRSQGTPHLAGRLWMRSRDDRESACREYDKGWLAHPERFTLSLRCTGRGSVHSIVRSAGLWRNRRFRSPTDRAEFFMAPAQNGGGPPG